MGKLIGVIALIASIAGTMDLVKSNKDTNKKIIWALVIWLIPIIGIILYFTVGKKA